MAASVLGLPRIAAARCASRAHTRVGTARPDARVASHDTYDEHGRSANRDSEQKTARIAKNATWRAPRAGPSRLIVA